MRLYRNLAIIVVIILALGAAYIFVQKLPDKKPEVAQTPAPTATTISLFTTTVDQIKQVSVKNPKESYTIVKNGEAWGVLEMDGVTFLPTALESAVSDYASITALMKVDETAERKAQFGLATPDATITVTLQDGTAKTFLIGDKVPGLSDRYMMEKDAGAIYTISSIKAQTIYKTTKDFRDTAIVTGKVEDVKSFQLVGRKGMIVDIAFREQDESNPYKTPFEMKSPYQSGVITEKFEEVIGKLVSISATSFGANRPSDADLVRYNLKNPEFRLRMTLSQTPYVMQVSRGSDGKIYAMVDGKSFVFTVDEAVYTTLSSVDAFALMEKFAHLFMIDNVVSVSVKGRGVEHEMLVQRDSSGQINSYLLDGKSIEEKKFKGAYEKLVSIPLGGVNQKQSDGVPAYTIDVKYKDGTSEQIIYSELDERNYILVKNGKGLHTVLKSKWEEALAAINEAAK